MPSGRVGADREDVFRSNDAFRDAVGEREDADTAEIESKMGRRSALLLP